MQIADENNVVIGWVKNFPLGALGYTTTINLWWFTYNNNPIFIDIATFKRFNEIIQLLGGEIYGI